MMRILRLCVGLFLVSVVTAAAAPITSIFVFGDSLSDDGNAFTLTGGFPAAPYAGRISNGPVAVEQLANRLGVALSPSTSGGSDYAVGGAATGPVAIPGTPIVTDNFAATEYGQPILADTGLLKQVSSFTSSGSLFDADESLFVVWGGPNDFFIDPSPSTAAGAVTNLANAIALLYGAGARRFLVPNMPDLSLTPSGRSLAPADQAGLRALTMGFNAGLDGALDALALKPNIDITRFDTFALLTAIVASPAAFGFTNADAPCYTGGLASAGVVCADAEHYVFWDSVHPTAAAHLVVGDAFARAVPEPATLTLLCIGVGWQITRRTRRSSIGRDRSA